METTLNPWPPDTADYVNHRILNAYIQDTSRKTKVHECTVYKTRVENVSKRGSVWRLQTSTLMKHSLEDQRIERLWVRVLLLYYRS